MKQNPIYCKGDFKMKLSPSYNWRVPFRLEFFTGTIINGKIAGRSLYRYAASYDGKDYTSCLPTEDGGLMVTFERHRLSPGVLCVEARYYLDDSMYADDTCDMAVKPEPVKDIDGNTFVVTCQENTCRKFTAEIPSYFQAVAMADVEIPLYIGDNLHICLKVGNGLKVNKDGGLEIDLPAIANI